ncbi:protein rolling stone-like [Mytilus californianus]|uniref:protein rolling stone-like n=1 Tax=Mytilus californianus TaxID=6549 RepID=UPI0022469BD3|nr:protein rolling stone-like [Mytilus californianus]
MVCEELKSELRLKNFGFGYPRPKVCILSQCGPKWLYLLCTTVFLIYHLSWLCYDIYVHVENKETDDELYFTKLPNWSYTLLITSSNLIDFICTLSIHCRRKDILHQSKDEAVAMPWYSQLNWLFFEISNTIAVIITIGFYSFLKPVGTPLALEYHVINSVYVLLSFFICSKPVRVLHFIYPEIYMGIYIVFSVIYQLGGNNPAIYSILDWNQPVRAMYTVLAVICVAVPIVHMTFFGLHIFRDRIYKCCKKQPGIEDMEYEDKEVKEATV